MLHALLRLVEIEMAAHGASVIEIQKNADGKWGLVGGSLYARRIDGLSSICELTGPAAGHARMKTKADPTGRRVIGMLNNCAGGLTPWGTVLTAEENFHGYFWGKLEAGHPEERNYKRYEVPGNWYKWGQHFDRFDVVKAGEAGLLVSSERLGVGLLGVNQVVNLNRHVR